jgi:thioredoxin 1
MEMNKLKIIKFEQPSCVPCKMVANFLNDKEIEYTTYNVLEDFAETEQYFIMSTPVTILLDNDGNEVNRVVGYNPGQLEELVSQL